MAIALGGCLKGPPVEFGLTEDTGGHITYVLGAATALAARADVARVEIVTRLIDEARLGPAYARPLEVLGPRLAIVRLDTGDRRYLSKEANAADRPAFLAALIRYLGALDRRPDVIHAHFADAGEVAMAVRDRFGIPFVYSAHSLAIEKAGASGTGDDGLLHRIAQEDAVIAAADAIVASSRDEAERQLMLYPGARPERIHRIPPGAALQPAHAVDTARARALVEPFLRDSAKPAVLAVARPVAKKNLAGLMDLFAAHPTLRRDCNLVIVAGLRDAPDSGEPEQREVIAGLLDRLDRHGLYGICALPKRHEQADIASLYAYARQTGGVFVNPAFTEPYGLTLTEAAIHGLPVVATCHGGAADIVAQLRHGEAVDPRDSVRFADAVVGLIADAPRWRRASLVGRRRSAALSWDAYAERFAGLARQLAPARAAPVAAVPATPARLLLCDIDNTLTGCRDGAREFADYLRDRPDIVFGVATGRSVQEAQRLLGEWRLPEPAVLVTSVGSEIYWREATGALVADAGYADGIARDWAPAEIVHRLAGVEGLVPQAPVEQRRFKRSWFAATPQAVARAAAALAGVPARIVASHGDFLDVLPARAGKGAAMAWVAHRLGVAAARVFAAGDSGNDLDMLLACANPILVTNHSDGVDRLIPAEPCHRSARGHAGGVVEGMRAHAARRATPALAPAIRSAA